MPILRLYPTSVTADSADFTANGAATKPDCIDDMAGAANEDTDFVGASTVTARIRFGFGNLPAGVVSVSEVTLRARIRRESGGNGDTGIFVRSGAADTDSPLLGVTNTTYKDFAQELLLDPNGSVPWTVAAVNALDGGIRQQSVDHIARITQLYMDVVCVLSPVRIGAARHKASTRIRQRRQAHPIHSAQIPAYYGDVLPFSNAAWSHHAIPTTADRGAGVVDLTQRRVCTRLGWKLNLNGKPYFRPRDFDLRDYSVNLWRTWHSREIPSAQKQGMCALDPGAGEVYVRAGDSWIDNPAAARAGTVQVVKVAADVQRYATEGLLIEPARTNDLLRSSFKSGLTGLTAVGTAGQTTLDTADLLFESGETANSLKITRNATAEDQGRTWPATAAYAANDRVVVSIDYKNDSGVAVSWYLRRSSDSNYYRDSDGTWQAAIQYNAPAVSTAIARAVSKVIDVGSGTPTLTLSVVHRSADANGTISRVYHCQIEKGRSATSRIITDTATVTRNRDDFKIENFSGKLVYDPARGTLYVEFVPNWNSADLESGNNPNLLLAFLDANNVDALRYAQSTGAFEFVRIVGGATFTASKVAAVTRGTKYRLACRWTGTNAEEGLSAFTISIFVDGVKGTDAVPGATWTPSASEYLYVGQNQSGAVPADGHLRQCVVKPFALSDAEVVDLP